MREGIIVNYNFFGGNKAKKFEVTEEFKLGGVEIKTPMEAIDDLGETAELADVVETINTILAALRTAGLLEESEEDPEEDPE